jgi:sugar (pentulose or hexulose) kinase
VDRILHENDFIVFKLTDKIATSANIAGKAHVDFQRSRYVEEIYDDVEVSLDLMAPIRPIGEVIGYVTEEASDETGIPAGIPVVNGMTDASAGDVATGTLKPGQANINIGTTLTLHAVVKEAIPDAHNRFYYKAYLDHNCLAGLATNAGTLPLDAISRLLKIPLGQLEREARKIPFGCDGLLAQPEWIGIRSLRNYPNVRGFFVNVDERNLTAGHLYRSVLEGNALVCLRILLIIEKVTGIHFDEIRTCGGGAKSNIQNATIADATGKTIKKVKEEDAAVGSSIIAMYAMHKTVPISDIASRIVKVESEHAPNPCMKKEYIRMSSKLLRIIRSIGKESE